MRTLRNPPTTQEIKPPRRIAGVWKRPVMGNEFGKTYIVDGEAVARGDARFASGGHWLWARYIPKGQFWIDSRLGADGCFIALHEWFENLLMQERGWDYHKAHNAANALEGDLRKLAHGQYFKIHHMIRITRKHFAHHLRNQLDLADIEMMARGMCYGMYLYRRVVRALGTRRSH